METDSGNVWEGCMDPDVSLAPTVNRFYFVLNFRAQIKSHVLDLAVAFVENANARSIWDGI